MLKSLELFGFKSFADRTRFDFAPGVTCVVGPNGSGKSNVVDSIKWILGDQSPKSLRGKEMTDVIFNGSGSRKPAPLAEALLNFDNSRRVLALDADEVQVGRRIYRSGESEYLINRVPARLKDIRDLFLGTGAGNSAYSIIEQGRVDQLLQATNIARRSVFEEAAGISRFKARKVDAQRKLERVAQNLLRLTDIVGEVETQLNALRYAGGQGREISRILAGAAHPAHRIDGRRLPPPPRAAGSHRRPAARTFGRDRRRRRRTPGIATPSRRQPKASLPRPKTASAPPSAARPKIARRLPDSRRRCGIRRHAGRSSRPITSGSQKQQIRAGRPGPGRRRRARTDRRRPAEIRRRCCDPQVGPGGGRSHHSRTGRPRRCSCRRPSKASAARCSNPVRSLSVVGSRAMPSRHSGKRSSAACDSARSRLAVARRNRSPSAGITCDDAGSSRSMRRMHGMPACAANCRPCSSGAANCTNGKPRPARTWPTCAKSAVRCRPGAALLEEFERRQEGLGVGVKEILALANEAVGPPWNHVLGHVVELLEVDLENAALLEVALGGRAQLIVLDDGRPLVDYLGRPHAPSSADVSAFWPSEWAPGESGNPDWAQSPGTHRQASICRDARASSAAPTVSSVRHREFTISPNCCWPTPGSSPTLELSPGSWLRRPAIPAGSSPCRENCSNPTGLSTWDLSAAKRRSSRGKASCGD